MPPDFFPVEVVQPEWVLQPEDMGGKEKFWYRKPGNDESDWLFKYPRPNSGEHWAEKVAAEVSGLLEIPCARVELAIFQGVRGSVSESFLSQNQQLFHGNQILSRGVGDYDEGRRFGQSRHTLENIWLALDLVFEEVEGADAAKIRFAEFLVLDAVIGNTDRHHENWGVAWRSTEDGGRIGYLAPSFDHASSLGRELKNQRRDGLLANNRIGNYLEKGSGGVYWSESDRNGPSPLELLKMAYSEHPALLNPILSKVAELDNEAVIEIVGRIAGDWMTDAARRFAMQLIIYNCEVLRELTE